MFTQLQSNAIIHTHIRRQSSVTGIRRQHRFTRNCERFLSRSIGLIRNMMGGVQLDNNLTYLHIFKTTLSLSLCVQSAHMVQFYQDQIIVMMTLFSHYGILFQVTRWINTDNLMTID